MFRTTCSVLALGLLLIGATLSLPADVEARPDVIKCHSGIDGSSICTVTVGPCRTEYVIRPDGSVTGGDVDCIK